MSFFNFNGRNMGKEAFIKESIAMWCHTAKIGHKIMVASPLGNYILEFKGKWKPPKSKIKIVTEEFL